MHERVKTPSLFVRQISQINTYVCLLIGDFHEILVLMTISMTEKPHQITLFFKGFVAVDKRSDKRQFKWHIKKKKKNSHLQFHITRGEPFHKYLLRF